MIRPAYVAGWPLPESAFLVGGGEWLKDDARSRVVRRMLDEQCLVVKQVHARSRGKALKRAFASSRAARAWRAGLMIEAIGVPTAVPVAYVERRLGALRGPSWLFSANVPGESALRYLLREDITDSERARVIEAIVGIYGCLHRNGVIHGDNKPGNFIVADGVVHVIDLDVTVRLPGWSGLRRRYMQRDFDRLVRRWLPHPEIARVFAEVIRRRHPAFRVKVAGRDGMQSGEWR